MVLLLLRQLGLCHFDTGLVQAVDDGVLALRDEDALDLAVVLEADLADGHAAVLLEIRPRRVDDGDVVLLVALDRVRLGQLTQVRDELARDGLPGVTLR